jgi:16S rRNA (cytosine967-C5)-methyltransferase
MSHFSFRENHLFKILTLFDAQRGPLDLFLRNYFRANKAVGSKDRRFISESIYGMIRWKGLLDHLCKKKPSWNERYQIYKTIDPTTYITEADMPTHIKVSFPKTYFHTLATSLGEQQAIEFCIASNQTAPTTIRVNALKTTRDALLNQWKDLYEISPSEVSPWGITFHKKINFFELPEFKAGLFEVQDEGSQLIAGLVNATPEERVLDYCAGSGGKTLGLAHTMRHRGQIYLHDIRTHALYEAKKRLCRAGIQNAQLLLPDDIAKKKLLKNTINWVIVDAPCSGTGTLRRNPDMKWKFEPEMVSQLVLEQRQIFEEALTFLHPHGSIVYATCSVLPQENDEQIAYFTKKFNLECTQEPFRSTPLPNKMDGFFGAVLKRK